MKKEKLCTECIHNKNGWCLERETNQGLKQLIECEFRKTKSVKIVADCNLSESEKDKIDDMQVKLDLVISAKEQGIIRNSRVNEYEEGVVGGLKIARDILMFLKKQN